MIRLAYIGVFLLAGLLAYGAFALVRGSGGNTVQIAQQPLPKATPAVAPAPVEPEIEKLFFLRDIDLDLGEITVILNRAGPDASTLIIRDQDVLRAAQDAAFVNTMATTISDVEPFVMSVNGGGSNSEKIAQVFRDDVLIATLNCASDICDGDQNDRDVNYANLIDASVPFQILSDHFDTYEDYISTIEAIIRDPNYMLLDRRPNEGFPQDRQIPTLTIELPNVIIAADELFDQTAYETLLRDTLTPLLAEDAAIGYVLVEDQSFAVLGDKDDNQPALLNGQPVPFPSAKFYTVRVQITGLTSVPPATYDALTERTAQRWDVDDAFETFVTSTLNTTCVDCYFLKVQGGFIDHARALGWQGESYSLDYYDLREAP